MGENHCSHGSLTASDATTRIGDDGDDSLKMGPTVSQSSCPMDEGEGSHGLTQEKTC